MALIYIVEDDENIREIETIALKNSNYMVCAFEKATTFYKKLEDAEKSCDKEIAGHYGDGKDRRNGYDQRSGRRGR